MSAAESGAGTRRGVVVDASVVLALLLPEAGSRAVRGLWERWVEDGTDVAGPILLACEVVSVLVRKVHRRELPPEAGHAALGAFLALRVELRHPPGIEERSWAVARRWNLPAAYDAFYVALAEMLDRDLWTADRRLVAAAAADLAPRLRLVEP